MSASNDSAIIAETGADDKNDSPIGKIGQAAMKAVLGDNGQLDLAKLKQLVHTESKTELKEIVKGNGFEELCIAMHATKIVGGPAHLIARDLNPGKLLSNASDLPSPADRVRMEQAINDAREYVQAGAHEIMKQDFWMKYTGQRGNVMLFYLHVAKNATIPGTYDLRFAITGGSFVPAPDFAVVMTSKSSYFKSKSSYKIEKLPSQLRQEHIEQVLLSAFPSIAGMVASLSEEEAGLLTNNAAN